jgi:hypothetical protein
MAWWNVSRRKKSLEAEIDSEIRFHINELTREKTAAGQSPGRARREALLEFGGSEQVKEEPRPGFDSKSITVAAGRRSGNAGRDSADWRRPAASQLSGTGPSLAWVRFQPCADPSHQRELGRNRRHEEAHSTNEPHIGRAACRAGYSRCCHHRHLAGTFWRSARRTQTTGRPGRDRRQDHGRRPVRIARLFHNHEDPAAGRRRLPRIRQLCRWHCGEPKLCKQLSGRVEGDWISPRAGWQLISSTSRDPWHCGRRPRAGSQP